MNKYIFLLTLLGLSFAVKAQVPPRNINYTYDASGNRIQRVQLAIGATCKQAASPQKDSLAGARITLFPNPSRNIINITMENVADTMQTRLFLYDSNGKLMQQNGPIGSHTALNLSGYAAGMYLLTLRRGEQETVWRVVKVD